MLNALAHRGLDATGTWLKHCVAFGHQTTHVTLESRIQQQPLHDQTAGLTITADVRLDNRKELFQRLEIPQNQRTDWSDSRLILVAYKKWGETLTDYLLGDFAFALWDEPKQKLICCRDPLGKRPLFYHHHQQCFTFASEVKGILATLPTVSLNKRKTALLAYRTTMKQETEATFFEGVLGLPAATIMTVTDQGIRQRVYWQPDVNARLGLRHDEEVLEALQALLFEVVQDHLRSAFPVGTLLSGGLDSSAIASVAAGCLAQHNETLTTFSSVIPKNNNTALRDEREYIELFRNWPNIELNYITACQRGPFDDLEQLVWGFESPCLTSRHYLYTAFAQAARKAGVRVILDGSGGELGLTYPSHGCYSELLLRGHWSTLWREFSLGRQRNGISAWAMFRTQILHPLIPAWAISLRPTTHKRQQDLQIIQPHFLAQQLGKQHAQLQKQQSTSGRVRPFHRDNQYPAIYRARKPSRVAGFIGYEQVQMRYPLLDKRLLEFCLAAPANLKIRDGYKRYLVRGSLNKILPTKIQWRTNKEPFSPDFYIRYNAQRAQVVALLAAIKLQDPVREVVDVEKLKRWAAHEMTATPSTTTENYVAGHMVPQGVYLITFLRQFNEFQV